MDEVTSLYTLKDTIGYGQVSEIKKAKVIRSGKTVAVKITNVPPESRFELEERIKLRMQLCHPAMCKVLQIVESPINIFIVMEYIKGMDLMTYVAINGKLPEDTVCQTLKQLLSLLVYLHDKGIALCDLSPDNIMVTFDENHKPSVLKIVGFDHIQSESTATTKSIHTPFFAAPEQILYKESSKASDMWSLGAIAYMLVCGYPPFFEASDLDLYSKVLTAEYQFQRPWWAAVSAPAQNFIRNLLLIDPNDRYTARDAADHYFLNPPSIENPRIFESHTTLARLSRASFGQKEKKKSNSGAIAGTTVDVVLFPLDTIKTRLQSKQGFIKAGGFSRIYSGLSSAALGSAPSASLFFVTYDTLKRKFSGSSYGVMAAASVGEMAACIVRVPTEVMKQRLQVGHFQSLNEAAMDIFTRQGILGFYRGYGTTIFREIPFACIQFPLFERLKAIYGNTKGKKINAVEAGLCGMVAGGTAAGLTTPLDVIKTRIMLSTKEGKHLKFSNICIDIYQQGGYRNFFSGIGPRVTWISIGGSIFLGVYEGVHEMFQ
ncbi:hypothetical protein HDV01_007637 [Terramyces sp. JEL0728]|nr:hypothetical protein HDV01_007637 [Terramyces sp. JEL0728]